MTAAWVSRLTASGMAVEDWGGIEPTELVAGTPKQHGLMVLDDKATGVSAGIWDCTAFTTKRAPYSVNEFMVLLEGSVAIVDANGKETVIKAGESFIIPKGLDCQWKQTGAVKKFFVIFNDASGLKPKAPEKLAVIKPDPMAELSQSGGPDPALVLAGSPQWRDRLYFEDLSRQWTVGVWSTTPYERKVLPFPRHEMMHILEGAVTVSDGAGRSETFNAGETLFVPKGAPVGWRNDVPVRKIYCIFQDKVAAVRTAAAE